MDDKKIQEILNDIEIPDAPLMAKEKAIQAAMMAHSGKNKNNFKGNDNSVRPIGNSNLLGRKIMKKIFVLSGMTSAVAVCALLAVGFGVIGKSPVGTTKTGLQVASVEDFTKNIKGFGNRVLDKSFMAGSIGAASSVPNIKIATSEADIVIASAETDGLVSNNISGKIAGTSKKDLDLATGGEMSPGIREDLNNRTEQRVQDGLEQVKTSLPEAVVKNEVQADKIVMAEAEEQPIARQNLEVKKEKKAFAAKRAPALSKAMMAAPLSAGATVQSSVMPNSHGLAVQDRIAIAPMPVIIDNPVNIGNKIVGQDEFSKIEDNNIKIVKSEPVSTLSVDVDTASYSFVRRMLNNGVLPQKNAVRVEELINYFNYDYKIPNDAAKPFEPTVAIYDSPWNVNNKLIHIGVKGHNIDKSEKPKSNLVFLIDTSGSMNSQDKLPLLKKSLSMLVNTLSAEDTISIVAYAGSAGTVLEPTSAKDKNKIISAMDRLRSGGSTSGGAGIKLAYNLAQQNFDEKAVNRVILATDGDFNVGITNHDELQDFIERKRDTGIFLSILGFGQGNYHDNLMQKLAQNGNGNAAYIDSLNEARKVLVDEAGSTLFTIAKDVKIQVEFNPNMVSEYRLIGYETRALKREDFNNDKVDAAEIGAGHSVTAIYEITPVNAKTMVDDLRYQTSDVEKKKLELSDDSEYAYLKMRYKLPKEDVSKLITRPITAADFKTMDNLSGDIKFAAAVAGFGQKLRGGKYIGKFSYDDIIKIANSAKGNDDFGYRSEFVNLVRTAKAISVPEKIEPVIIQPEVIENKVILDKPIPVKPMAPMPEQEYHDSKTHQESLKKRVLEEVKAIEDKVEQEQLKPIGMEDKFGFDDIMPPMPGEEEIAPIEIKDKEVKMNQ